LLLPCRHRQGIFFVLMQKVIITLFLVVMLGCHTPRKTTKAVSSTEVNANQQPAGNNTNADAGALPVDYENGQAMISALDCTVCHTLNERQTGPAYISVAQKYKATEANINKLAQKIITGGSGNWGKVPMTQHPDLNIDSAKIIVRFILSLGSK